MFKDFNKRLQRDIKRYVDARMRQTEELSKGRIKVRMTRTTVRGEGAGPGAHWLPRPTLATRACSARCHRRQRHLAQDAALRRLVRWQHARLDGTPAGCAASRDERRSLKPPWLRAHGRWTCPRTSSTRCATPSRTTWSAGRPSRATTPCLAAYNKRSRAGVEARDGTTLNPLKMAGAEPIRALYATP